MIKIIILGKTKLYKLNKIIVPSYMIIVTAISALSLVVNPLNFFLSWREWTGQFLKPQIACSRLPTATRAARTAAQALQLVITLAWVTVSAGVISHKGILRLQEDFS